jgi:hypothetical protein
MTLQYYRIYVRLKSGGQATGRDLHNGSPPASGTRLDVPLITGRTVKAEIGPLPNAKQAKPFFRGSVVSVYADEL